MGTGRILVTGATGFVGRALCAELAARKVPVRGAVRAEEAGSALPAGVETVAISSVGPYTDWAEALAGVEVVVHLAARVHVMAETDPDPLAAYRRVNAAGTEKLARAAAAEAVQRLVFVSSVKVNGEESRARYTERDRPAPLDPYGVSKLEAEEALWKVSAVTGLEAVVLRLPLVYGPGVKANFYRLLAVVAKGVPLPLGSAANSRSMLYLGNLIDAVAACAAHPQAAGKTFLVSDGEDVSTAELVRRVSAAFGRPPRLFPFPPGLMRLAGRLAGRTAAVDRLLGSLTVDSGRIRRELGWKPPFTMAEGLRATADWYMGERLKAKG